MNLVWEDTDKRAAICRSQSTSAFSLRLLLDPLCQCEFSAKVGNVYWQAIQGSVPAPHKGLVGRHYWCCNDFHICSAESFWRWRRCFSRGGPIGHRSTTVDENLWIPDPSRFISVKPPHPVVVGVDQPSFFHHAPSGHQPISRSRLTNHCWQRLVR